MTGFNFQLALRTFASSGGNFSDDILKYDHFPSRERLSPQSKGISGRTKELCDGLTVEKNMVCAADLVPIYIITAALFALI